MRWGKFGIVHTSFSIQKAMNLIQEDSDQIKSFTDLGKVANWLGIELKDYDWHLADAQFYPTWKDFTDPCWVKGEKLSAHITKFNPQFIWAVLSAFPKNSPPILSDQPHADMNPTFWSGIPERQLRTSIFEIVCWDSSATLFIDLPEDLGKRLLANAPGTKDLNEENERRMNQDS